MSALTTVRLAPLPDLGPEPVLDEAIYRNRIARLRERMAQDGLDAVLVYADREHAANVAHLTGFDPRFEEALLLVPASGDVVAITGIENLPFTAQAGLPVRAVLCQAFGLPGQDRSGQRRLADALAEAGLLRGARTGLVGWKTIPRADAPAGPYAFAVPQFVISEIEDRLDGPLRDATPLLCGTEGLRAVNEADQLAVAEHRAARASQCVWRGLQALRPGVSELEVTAGMGLVGVPLAAHVMCTTGPESVVGLASPTDRRIERGDRCSMAVAFWGGLTARAGIVREADDPELGPFLERFARPYAAALRTWWETVAVGVEAGVVSRAVRARLEGTAVRPLLDAGHLIGLEEWLDALFDPASEERLRSGMALQADIIPVNDAEPGDVANCEDSLALADEELRAELRERHPRTWERIERRRAFMRDELGIACAEDVLPFSERPAAFVPALLSPEAVLTG